jgi:hypothetical protein
MKLLLRRANPKPPACVSEFAAKIFWLIKRMDDYKEGGLLVEAAFCYSSACLR